MKRSVRVIEAVSALLSAGVLVVGVVLAVLLVAVPALDHGSGPRWDRVLVAVLAGVAGELVHRRRNELSGRARGVMAGLVIVAVLGALWWAWWR